MNSVPSCDIQIVRAVTDVFPLNYVFANGYKTIANMSQNPQHVINPWHVVAMHWRFCLRFAMIFVSNSNYMFKRKWREAQLALLRFVYYAIGLNSPFVYIQLDQVLSALQYYYVCYAKFRLHLQRNSLMFEMLWSLIKIWHYYLHHCMVYVIFVCSKIAPIHHDIDYEILEMRDISFGWNSNMSPFEEGRQLKI